MKIVCIDIGNSTLHAGVSANGQITDHLHLTSKGSDKDNSDLLGYLKMHEPEMVVYCSVVPEAAQSLEALLRKNGYKYFRLTCDNSPGLQINYPIPQEIGEDRLANAIAAHEFYGSPSIVIDMGTAVTFDVIGKSGAYEGGVIAPGLEVMTRYLHEQTALLPELDPDEFIALGNIGKSTSDAMKLGCAVGFTGMIGALLDRVLGGLASAENETIPIVGTGGSAYVLLKNLNREIVIDSDITLKGLAEAWRRHTINQ